MCRCSRHLSYKSSVFRSNSDLSHDQFRAHFRARSASGKRARLPLRSEAEMKKIGITNSQLIDAPFHFEHMSRIKKKYRKAVMVVDVEIHEAVGLQRSSTVFDFVCIHRAPSKSRGKVPPFTVMVGTLSNLQKWLEKQSFHIRTDADSTRVISICLVDPSDIQMNHLTFPQIPPAPLGAKGCVFVAEWL